MLFITLHSTGKTLIKGVRHRNDHVRPVAVLDSQVATLEEPDEQHLKIGSAAPAAQNAQTIVSSVSRWSGRPTR